MSKRQNDERRMDAVLNRIHGTTNIGDFSDRDLVVEAVIENMEMKKKLFAELDKICPQNAILATNTPVYRLSIWR